MIKIIFLLLLTFFGIKIQAQVFLSGQIKNLPDSAVVSLTYFNNSFEYEQITLGTVKPDKAGNFKLLLDLQHSSTVTMTIAEQYTDLYLVPKDSLQVSIDYERFDSTIVYTGRGAADNNYMAAEVLANFNWQAQLHRDFDDADLFTAFEDSLERENQAFFKAHVSPDFSNDFRNHITAQTKYRYIYPRCMFTVMYNSTTNQFEKRKVPEHYFNFLKTLNIDDQDAAENSVYESAIWNNYMGELYQDKIEKEIPDSLSKIEKDRLRTTKSYNLRKQLFKGKILDYQLTHYLKSAITYRFTDMKFIGTLIEDYKTICKNPEYIAVVDRAFSKALELEAGHPAPDFTLTDMKGKNVSLSSFKGKVVYIDFWATWCGPCIAEMPRSHELMEKFSKNKNVVFLYINVRDEKENWEKYVTKHKMKGIVLYANTKQSASLSQAYNFSGIPRYVLIDKNGNLINSNAKSPGSVEQDILKALQP